MVETTYQDVLNAKVPRDIYDRFIEQNIVAVLKIEREFKPVMIENDKGEIELQIGQYYSISGEIGRKSMLWKCKKCDCIVFDPTNHPLACHLKELQPIFRD